MKTNLPRLFCMAFFITICACNVFAQTKGTRVDVEGWTYSGVSKSYDRQTLNSVYPMTQRHDDGFIGSTWTNEDNPKFEGSKTPFRGIGYAYSTDGGITWSEQENRVAGIPIYWPSYAQWGKNGEAILGRSADTYKYNGIQIKEGLVLLTRPNKGKGEWTITSVPYPAGYSDGIMAWARMTTSGIEHQFIHIMTPMRRSYVLGDEYFVFYYRTQDGGTTWDIPGKLVSEMVGQEWPTCFDYIDAISFAVQGNTVACSFINGSSHGYVLRSNNNGDIWESIKFFDSPIHKFYPIYYEEETFYIPEQGCIALDNDGKIHVAFAAWACSIYELFEGECNSAYGYQWIEASFLSYWNEDMEPINASTDFHKEMIFPKLNEEYFDFTQSNDSILYVKSTVPKWPVIGYYTPTHDNHLFSLDKNIIENWAFRCQSAGFSFPQMAFDKNNVLHLVYLGLLDGGKDGEHWYRHPFYTTSSDGGKTWTKTEYLVNKNELKNKEFAYLTLAGLGDNKMYLMAQVDDHAGIYCKSNPSLSDHEPTDNYFYYFSITGIPTQSIEYYKNTSLQMSLFPNPAMGQVNVKFEGKGELIVTNMLGQIVYYAENVENEKRVLLHNMSAGVYFVTVRLENDEVIQKLIVK